MDEQIKVEEGNNSEQSLPNGLFGVEKKERKNVRKLVWALVILVIAICLIVAIGSFLVWIFVSFNSVTSKRVDIGKVSPGMPHDQALLDLDDKQVASTSPINTIGSASEIILDVSGSMAGKLDGKTKIDIAKDSFKLMIGVWPDDNLVGFRVYGAKDPVSANNCQDTELLYPVGPADADLFVSKLSALTPNGWTPIEYSLNEAQKDFAQISNDIDKKIVLISDGEETCGGDPCQAVKDLIAGGFSVTVDTIGVGVDAKTKTQLKCIAQAGNGKYYDVNSEKSFREAISYSLPSLPTADNWVARLKLPKIPDLPARAF